MTNRLLEQLLSNATMFEAERELVAMGAVAVPILMSILDGNAKNKFGVAYRDLGLPLRCAIEVASRLGPLAKPLETLLVEDVSRGSSPATRALGYLGSLDAASISALVCCLESRDDDLATESAAALIRCGQENHLAVTHATARSARVANTILMVQQHLKR